MEFKPFFPVYWKLWQDSLSLEREVNSKNLSPRSRIKRQAQAMPIVTQEEAYHSFVPRLLLISPFSSYKYTLLTHISSHPGRLSIWVPFILVEIYLLFEPDGHLHELIGKTWYITSSDVYDFWNLYRLTNFFVDAIFLSFFMHGSDALCSYMSYINFCTHFLIRLRSSTHDY